MTEQGFEDCPDAVAENGFEKIAIYTDPDGEPQHIARQLPNGLWTSKLGDDCDIQHNTLRGLEGDNYGRATCFMKRATSGKSTGITLPSAPQGDSPSIAPTFPADR